MTFGQLVGTVRERPTYRVQHGVVTPASKSVDEQVRQTLRVAVSDAMWYRPLVGRMALRDQWNKE